MPRGEQAKIRKKQAKRSPDPLNPTLGTFMHSETYMVRDCHVFAFPITRYLTNEELSVFIEFSKLQRKIEVTPNSRRRELLIKTRNNKMAEMRKMGFRFSVEGIGNLYYVNHRNAPLEAGLLEEHFEPFEQKEPERVEQSDIQPLVSQFRLFCLEELPNVPEVPEVVLQAEVKQPEPSRARWCTIL